MICFCFFVGGGGVNAAKVWIMAVSVEVICYASNTRG